MGEPGLKSLGINRAIRLEAERADARIVRMSRIEVLMHPRCHFLVTAILQLQRKLLGQVLRKKPVCAAPPYTQHELRFRAAPRQVEKPSAKLRLDHRACRIGLYGAGEQGKYPLGGLGRIEVVAAERLANRNLHGWLRAFLQKQCVIPRRTL